MIWSAALTAVPLATPQPNTLELILLGVFGFAAMARLATRGLYGARPARMSVLDTIRHSSASVLMAGVFALALAAVAHATAGAADALAPTLVLATAGVATMRSALALSRDEARRRGASTKRTLIVGAGVVGAQIERRLLARPSLGLRPIGFLDSDPGPGFWHQQARGPVLGPLSALAE